MWILTDNSTYSELTLFHQQCFLPQLMTISSFQLFWPKVPVIRDAISLSHITFNPSGNPVGSTLNMFRTLSLLPHLVLVQVATISSLLLSHFSRVRLCATPQTAAHQAPIPGILQARTLEWVAISFSNLQLGLLQQSPNRSYCFYPCPLQSILNSSHSEPLKIEVTSCDSSAQNPTLTPHFTPSKSQSPYSGPQGPTPASYFPDFISHYSLPQLPCSCYTGLGCSSHYPHIQSLHWLVSSWEKAMASHSSTVAQKIPWIFWRSLVGCSPWGR